MILTIVKGMISTLREDFTLYVQEFRVEGVNELTSVFMFIGIL